MTEADEFDEHLYLLANPDVAQAVQAGILKSGAEHYEMFGKFEGRRCNIPSTQSLRATILANIRTGGKGLEVGPSHNPVAPRRDGFDVDIVDHMDEAELKQKYSDHDVEIENIEDVDFVWNGEPLSELIGKADHYDWIIASHVIEHVPDPITFLRECQRLLRREGRLALIIPDKRFCFDHLQGTTFTGALLDAMEEKRTRPTPGQIFDYLANACKLDEKSSWGAAGADSLSLLHSFDMAAAFWRRALGNSDYLDVHCWRFTPESFGLIVSDLNALGLLQLAPIAERETVGNEFCYILSKAEYHKQPIGRINLLVRIGSHL